MNISARITFADGKPQDFLFHATTDGRLWHWPNCDDCQFTGGHWRLLAADCAVELRPLCRADASLLRDEQGKHQPAPACDRLEIWPVSWGYPDSLVADHPAQVEQMRQDHLAGKHELVNGNYTWKPWLDQYGKAQLWDRFRTPEMERNWLCWHTPPGSTLFTFSRFRGRIPPGLLPRIQFRADFHSDTTCQTIYLENCVKAVLTAEERSQSPSHIAQQNNRISRQTELEAAKSGNLAKEKSLVTVKMKLEAKRRQRQEDDAKIAQQRAKQPVTRATCCVELKVGDRQLRKICTRFELKVPQTRQQLDALLAKHLRHKKSIAEAQAKRNKDRLQ